MVIVERLLNVDGQLHINSRKVNVTESVNLPDSYGNSAKFVPIGIIHHTGVITSGQDTRGHYMADILHKQSGKWIRTSDDARPFPLNEPTSNGYIFVLQKEGNFQ